MPNNLAMTLSDVELGTPQIRGTMCVVPILTRHAPLRTYLTTSEAMAREGLQITEISSDGSVPSLRATNELAKGILLVDGEELIGAKQNRVVNLSVLVAAGSTVTLPVSCVEAGRWDAVSDSMETSGYLDALPIRRKRIESVTKSARRQEGFNSDQIEVWDHVAEVLADGNSESRTSAMRDAYSARATELDEYEQAFSPLLHQTGAIVAIDGRWTTIELFSHSDIYAAHAGKIIRSSAMAAARRETRMLPNAAEAEAGTILREVLQAETEAHVVVGLGTNLRFETERWQGSALRDADEIIHLVAYAR